MEKHVNVISVLWIVYGALGIFFAFFIFWFFTGISYLPDMDSEGSYILRWVGICGSIFIGTLSLPEIIAGIGLMKRKEWGRIFVLVVSFLNLIGFPLGTALGVYSIIILFNEETVQLFNP